MKSWCFALSGVFTSVVSLTVLIYWYVNFYKPGEHINYYLSNIRMLLVTAAAALLGAMIAWLFTRRSFFEYFKWTLFGASVIFAVLNLFAVYLMQDLGGQQG